MQWNRIEIISVRGGELFCQQTAKPPQRMEGRKDPLNIAILGDKGVGKSLLSKKLSGSFEADDEDKKIVASKFTYKIDDKEVALCVWDFAGEV